MPSVIRLVIIAITLCLLIYSNAYAAGWENVTWYGFFKGVFLDIPGTFIREKLYLWFGINISLGRAQLFVYIFYLAITVWLFIIKKDMPRQTAEREVALMVFSVSLFLDAIILLAAIASIT